MFESSEFLDQYVPDYFKRIFLSTYSMNSTQKTNKSFLEFMSSFIKFAFNLYSKQGMENHFNQFMYKQFFSPNTNKNNGTSKQGNSNILKKERIMEFIESNIDKIQLTFIQLYLKIYKFEMDIKNKKLQSQQIQVYSQKLLKSFNESRLQFELNRFQLNVQKDYDDFILQIFSFIFSEPISKDMSDIIMSTLSNQCSNVNQNTLQKIQNMLNNKKKDHESVKHTQKSPSKIKKFLVKKNKKTQKNSPIQKRLFNLDKNSKLEQAATSPLKTSKPRQSHSPLNRIQSYAKLKKQKPINKKRTIYYQRKNMYLPKMKQWIQKFHSFASQKTLPSNQFEKSTQKKMFRFQNSQSTFDDYDNQSILVRSTPKPLKKASIMKVISQKLDF